jgi:hypothetical protein
MNNLDELIQILLRLEERITRIEDFINSYDFSVLPEIKEINNESI